MLGELGGGRYLLDHVEHDAARAHADEVPLPERLVAQRQDDPQARLLEPLVLRSGVRNLEVEQEAGGRLPAEPSGIVSCVGESTASS